MTTTLHPGKDGAGVVKRTVLPGGLRVVTESMPTVRSVAVGMWVGIGSRDESPQHMGSSHFLEHLLFKGTPTRDALEISAAIEGIGGEINAFTAKEYTCYYARVLDEDLRVAIDVLADVVTSSLITDEDVEAERGVILEEIAMHDDDPSDVVHEQFSTELYGDTPVGRPILGTVDSITAVTRDRIAEYYRRYYLPTHTVVSVAGNVDHEQVVALVAAAYERAGALGGDASPVPPRVSGPGVETRSGTRVVHRPTEQANLVLGTTALTRTDERRFALGVLNAALGGGMSSRLFQEIREKRGLAYSAYSYTSALADTGQFGIYVGCLPSKIDDVLKICREEVLRVIADGITEEEIVRGKGQMRGGLVLGLEDTGSRMSRIGKGELVFDELLSVDDLLGRIDAVTSEEISEVAADVLNRPMSLAVIGPYDDDKDFSAALVS
ncbi:insulinase family protein [Streptosporangium sp. NBC_01755]|uniref:M16 family metallopeptidase n=1 Tax=unclassified Streptosporangium TaxID=2632669 RepID=UPI002DDB598C|nr:MULTISPECIES: pitrilysin family protein [unclassified Streptosporangium]WSA29683.1 insulinase family protein [Streptosporangium sp. NBC_01810]WSD04174.1 insulinase family protein [Streptosporangium sp. NBC_01755]